MERTYNPSTTHVQPPDLDVPSLFLTAERAMKSLVPSADKWPISVSAQLTDDVWVRGDNLRELLLDLRESGDDIRMLELIYGRSRYLGGPNLDVTVYKSDNEVRLEIASASNNESDAKGRLAALDQRIAKWLANPVEVSLDPPSAASTYSAPGEGMEPTGWWRRSWRDHTAAVAVGVIATILGTIIAALILARVFDIG